MTSPQTYERSGPECPPDLLAAFEAYEGAVMANDLPALSAWFAPGSGTLRGDSNGLLVGHGAISDFRASRGGVSSRTITRLECRPLGEDVAVIASVSMFHDGGSGLQTQVWKRLPEGWRIAAAHVTPKPRAFDRTVWRVVGDPLVAPAVGAGPDAVAGEALPLAGVDVAVKDLFAIEGQRIGAGNPTYLAGARVEPAHAAAVADLLRGGAAIAGIARTDEFAFSIAGVNAHAGTPPNGAVHGAIPGGSSSGPASAVAAGIATVGLATDTAGSIRVPSSYQGLWGLRTTFGAVPRDGMLPLAPSFDTVGWIARDGRTLQRVVDWSLEAGAGSAAGVGAVAGSGASHGADAPREAALGGAPGARGIPPRLVAPQALVDCADSATRAAFASWAEAAGVPASHADGIDEETLSRGAEAFRLVQGAEA
ncbi:MAG: AtzH-like domain-containing protein, partial [Pseudoclavibacter sp.]